jgi:hypothetical protein
MGATSVHEGSGFPRLAARRAFVPRWGVSPADAKWPLSMEGALGRRSHHRSRGLVGEAALAAPARESPREGVDTGSKETGVGDATGASEVIRIGCAGSNKPYAVTQARERVDAVHRSGGNQAGDVITLLPRPRGGSQNPSFPPAGVSLGDSTGNSTSAGVCSREFGKQTSVGRIGVFSRDVALQGDAPRGDLARRKP